MSARKGGEPVGLEAKRSDWIAGCDDIVFSANLGGRDIWITEP